MKEKYEFNIGDIVKVYYKIKEGAKERIQPFEGVVMAKKGAGVSKTFTVRRIGAAKVGVERIFPFNSPNIEKVDVTKTQKVRRAKLYYLRNRDGLQL
ncbi:50S ribosomal protein L19 [candidate division WWE3 bacterium CG09_land_8_20_14_0_10_39_24]|uniref:50S ribosomal protein L19 n=2 Tax=Katanobacteria TaxID=422282 RepID=A0A2G9XC74_UNCKA|nr:MAG: 50S ribosomal protein L19 [bacterium CG2_30_40_12]OJI08185.1 MAG: 50S ribosomal protein L19 [bacterium CG09_39_24]PIP04562.1 MAG: 50S ribosomal protein L19 [candidate division WWE3 bacterium CG23_combo_of_CG06-09_8_20_14_all_40_14]PIS12627.1 MAG: 50S ribosomal protein L19 [candidate division WWE3 bacterium CG09_land_8_20_14_0_10_39_24]PJE51971.1 MAG: 50S ribosomal protein L19 [candidate division WWE3 bacterium CG10_big_fil_rev_8_21_14_0_10_39_14]